MRIMVIDDSKTVICDYDDHNSLETMAYPADLAIRRTVITLLTEVLKCLLFKKPGGLDNEV